jgi:hypothetical protein
VEFVDIAQVAARCGVPAEFALEVAAGQKITVWRSGSVPCVAMTDAGRLAAAIGRAPRS